MSTLKNETEFVFSKEFIGFTTIPNTIFSNKDLSFKAIGIYCSILQFQNSPNHVISVKGLMAIHSDGQKSVQAGLNELIEAGFLYREQIRERGIIKGVRYTVYLKPIESQCVEPEVQKAYTDNVDVLNAYNKKENSKKQNTKNKITTHKKDIDSAESVVDITNKSIIESKTNLTLTPYQTKTVSKWNIEQLNAAINIYNNNEGQTFALLLKVYRDGAINNLTNKYISGAISSKVAKFNDLGENSRKWDFDEIERLERKYIDNMLKNSPS